MMNKWRRPDYYIGPDYDDYFVSFSQHRDSDTLTRSNFEVASKQLEEFEGVEIIKDNHFLVGWVEYILVPESNDKAVKIAQELHDRVENYPILCEEHFSQLEDTEAQEVWQNCYDVSERVRYIRQYGSEYWFSDYAELLSCCRGEWYPGDSATLCTR